MYKGEKKYAYKDSLKLKKNYNHINASTVEWI